ncbi:hypothetical protein [Marinobacter phage PS3]|nr:hypothetical protein [Marinobacter phage PS3]
MSTHTTPLYEAARMLNLGPQKLFSALRHRKVLTKENLPYRQYVDQGLFTTELKEFKHPTLGPQIYARAHVTQQGLKWLADEFEVPITRETANNCAANGASH